MADVADPRPPRPKNRDAARLARHAAIINAERTLERASAGAIDGLLASAARQLAAAGYDPSVLDVRSPEWAAVVEADVLPAITAAYVGGLHLEVLQGSIDATPYSVRHLESVRNRLVGVADEVFDPIRLALRDGMLQGEGIPDLARRTDALLGDSARWANRARTIARTEVIAANNAGASDGARYAAGVMGHDPAVVCKEWLATSDTRTRETHVTAGGTQVLGMDTAFDVGGYPMQYPGDPAGPGSQTVNCRCTILHLMPGDRNYPEALAAEQAPAALPPELVPPVKVDPVDLDDASLEDEMMRLAALGDYTSARATQVAAELDRRDAVNLDALTATPEPLVEQAIFTEAVGDLTSSRGAAARRRGKSESRDAERADYEAYIDAQMIRAEADTNGNVLSKRAQAEGRDARDLFTRRLRSLPAHATEELQRWFADNERLSFDQWRGRRAQTSGYESEFG